MTIKYSSHKIVSSMLKKSMGEQLPTTKHKGVTGNPIQVRVSYGFSDKSSFVLKYGENLLTECIEQFPTRSSRS